MSAQVGIEEIEHEEGASEERRKGLTRIRAFPNLTVIPVATFAAVCSTARILIIGCFCEQQYGRARDIEEPSMTYLTNNDVQIEAPMTRPSAETIDQNEAMRNVNRVGITPKMNAKSAAQDPIYLSSERGGEDRSAVRER